jgi:hypothetical protein
MKTSMRRTGILAAAAAVALVSCKKKQAAPDILMAPSHAGESAAETAPAPAAPVSADGSLVQVAGISFAAPPSWRREPPSSSMRAAQFAIPGGGNEKDGSVAVYYFGTGQGGGVDENVARWQGQFSDPSGTPPVPSVTHSESHGLKVTIVTVKGTYASGMPMGPSTPEPGFALWGAIIENPQGSVFVKATGPSALIAREQPRFEELLASLRPSTSM